MRGFMVAKTKMIEKKDFFKSKYAHLLFIGLLFLILSVFFFKIAFLGYAPPASDSIQWRSSAESLIEYNKTHEDQALWNSNLFSGMPGYLVQLSAKYPYINDLRRFSEKLINWRIFLLFTAGLGMYLLMIFLGFEPIVAFISAISFSLSCHFIGLLEIGHNTKFRAVIYIPWIFMAVHYLKEKRNLLGLGLTSLFIIGQLRENHPQISYYTFIMLGIYWIFQLVRSIKEKEINKFTVFTTFILLAFIISILAVAHPYLSNKEFGEYTIRGGSEGLLSHKDTNYVTQWSFHPAEIISFLIPNFFGGVSPYYWGWMPFTQASMYMGVIIFLLAILGVIKSKSYLVKILMTVSIVSLLMSFGRHLPFFSNFLLNYLPGFNKFRVPAMILVLLQFSVVVLAGYGLKVILQKFEEKDKKFFDIIQKIMIVVAVIFFIFILSSSFFAKMNLMQNGEIEKIKKQYVEHYGKSDGLKYAAQKIIELKSERLDKLVSDGIQAFLLIIAFLGLTIVFGREKISKYIYLILVLALVVLDLLIVDSRFLQNLTPQKAIEKNLVKTQTDKFLLNDKETFRIYPLGGEFGQNKWTAYHQSIGGYHGAKLKRYQEIIENCLNAEFKDRIPINWNIVNMLNAKYVIFNQKIPLENLEYAFHDRKQKLTTYKNLEYLPRAWFVKNLEIIKEKENIWKRLNNPEFNPAETAIVETDLHKISSPDSTSVKLIDYGLHNLKFEVETDTTSFLTVSEIYYPAGWKAFLDGKETEIYPTNYIFRGVVVPKGKHILEMKFEPETYKLSLKLSLIGILSSIIILIIGAFLFYRKNYKGKINYVIKK